MPKIDLLILNAGIMDAPAVVSYRFKAFNFEVQFTDYGTEIHFASNHLGHFLLTKLLIQHMAHDSRIINITSGMYTKVNFKDVDL